VAGVHGGGKALLGVIIQLRIERRYGTTAAVRTFNGFYYIIGITWNILGGGAVQVGDMPIIVDSALHVISLTDSVAQTLHIAVILG